MTAPHRKPHARRAARARSPTGKIDTVIVAFTDMQGRLVGKRVSARLFLEDVAAHGAECCNYLLAVDVEMNTVDGYAMSSWERGYGDMAMIPDLRRCAWRRGCPATALVTADLQWLDGTPVEASPRRILQRQLDRLAERGLAAFVGTELEFIVFDDSLPRRLARRATAASPRRATTTSTTRCSRRPAWSRCCATSGTRWTAPACTARA